MQTTQYKHRKLGEGRYVCVVRPIGDNGDWQVVPGCVLGGNGRYVIQHGGNQWPTVRKTLRDAIAALADEHFGFSHSY